MNYFPLQDAKARLSELVKRVINEGPLGISVRGKEEIILLSKKEYDILSGEKPSFLELMASSPLRGGELNLKRDKSFSRNI